MRGWSREHAVMAATLATGLGAASLAACGGGSGGGGGGATSTTTASGSSSGSSGSTGGAGGSGPIASYTPEGCAFSIAPRPEYLGFSLGSPVVGATPNIRRVRLGLGGNVDVGAPGRADPSTSIGVAWQTDEGTLSSEITWGTDPDPAKWPAANRRSGVRWATPSGTGQFDEHMHEVHVCGLSPATTYYYRVCGGPAGSEAWSEVQSFATTPAAGPAQITIGIAGDSRGENGDAWRLFARRMTSLSPTLALFSGDMINLAIDQSAWEKWLDSASKDSDDKPLSLGRVLTLYTHGNHENHTTFFYGNLVLPQDPVKYPKHTELFYSVDVGPVHIVVIDDMGVVSPTTDPDYAALLTEWLDKDLSAANQNRAKVPWIVTMHHHGEFSSSAHGTDKDVLRGRQFFVPLWDKHHVDVDIAGHDHNYERSKPLSGPLMGPDLMPAIKPSPEEGTVYVICAGAGAPAYSPGTSAFTEVSHGYKTGGAVGLFSVATVDEHSFKLDAFELRPDGSDPLFDSFTIQKP